MFKKSLSFMLCLVLLLGLIIVAPFNVRAEGETEEEAKAGTHTLRYAMGSSPLNWNPHTWEVSNESEMMSYLYAPFVYSTIAEDGVNWTWAYEGAESMTDITKDFADKEKWGVPADATEGIVWEIKINPLLKWDDGTEIKAEDFVWSMIKLIDPKMKNRRSDTYTMNDYEIVGAFDYFNSDKAGQPRYKMVDKGEEGYIEGEDGKLYVNLSEADLFFGEAPTKYYENEKYKEMFMKDGEDLYEKYSKEYVEVNDDVKADLLVIAKNFGDENEEAWKEFCFYADGVWPEGKPENVGIYATDDTTFVVILKNPTTQFYFNIGFDGGWLVKKDLYEANYKEVGDLLNTEYCTTLDTSASYGPYKLASFEKDKQFVLERNEHWVGYNDGKHEGEFQADRVIYDIVADHNTQKQLFLQGKLDSLGLEAEDLATYRFSDYLMLTDLSYTFRFVFATSLESLKTLEEEQKEGNKRILHYKDFRIAISRAMDRQRLCAEATGANKPAYFLFNNLYYYDIEHNPDSQYRRSDEGKEAVLRLYDVKWGEGTPYATIDEAYDSITGYDVEEAKELFTKAYEEAVKDGNYEDGQKIIIRCMASAADSLTPDDTKQQDLMNEFVAKATEGTPLEGKIEFRFLSGSKTRYDDVANGKIEMIRGAWGGAAFFPFKTIGVYVDPDQVGGLNKIHESNGWNPTTEELTINYDFNGDGTPEDETHTLTEWFKLYTDATNEYCKNIKIRLHILSELETAVMASYQCIPWSTETSCSLHSQKVEMATYDYNIMYGYGGDRLLTFNYDDAEWAEYVAEEGGELSYE